MSQKNYTETDILAQVSGTGQSVPSPPPPPSHSSTQSPELPPLELLPPPALALESDIVVPRKFSIGDKVMWRVTEIIFHRENPNKICYGEIIGILHSETREYVVKRSHRNPTREETGRRRRSTRLSGINNWERREAEEQELIDRFDTAEEYEGFNTLISYFGAGQLELGAVLWQSGMPPLAGEGYENQADKLVGRMEEKNLLSIRNTGENPGAY